MTAKYEFDGVFSSLKNKNPNKSKERDELKKREDPMPKNIYDYKTVGEAIKGYDFLHYVFKTWFLEPGIKVLAKVIDSQRVREVPDEPWNVNFKVFDDAFERAIRSWIKDYLGCSQGPGKTFSPEKVEHDSVHGKPQQMLRLCKELAMTIGLRDTAYREFFNIFVFELANAVIKEYSPSKEHMEEVKEKLANVYGKVSQEEYENLKEELLRNRVKHLLYTYSDIVFPQYFALYPMLNKEQKMEREDGKKQ